MKCIDPWLTKNRRVCPVCKAKVILPGMSDISDTDDEREAQNVDATSERTPLLPGNRPPRRQRRRTRPSQRSSQRENSDSSRRPRSATSPSSYNAQDQPNTRVQSNGSLLTLAADITPTVLAPTHMSVNFAGDNEPLSDADSSVPSASVDPEARFEPPSQVNSDPTV